MSHCWGAGIFTGRDTASISAFGRCRRRFRDARSRLTKVACCVALAWSVLLAATGALAYPAERWNTDPTEIDRDHARLWDWRDPQFVRCWKRGFSPDNFNLFGGVRS
jgi:hypothetical protein